MRYTDTCYVIFQQWQKGLDRATFPIVYNYVYNKNKFDKIEEIDRKNFEALALIKDDTIKVDDDNMSHTAAASKEITDQKTTVKKLKSRKSRSLERKRNRGENTVKYKSHSDGESTDHVDGGCDTANSTETIVANGTTSVEVHQIPKSAAAESIFLQIKEGEPGLQPNQQSEEKTDITKESNYAEPKESQSRINNFSNEGNLDINHNSITSEKSDEKVEQNNNNNNNNIDSVSDKVMLSVPIRRKQFHRISDSSSFDESEETDSDYATVHLRNVVSLYGETLVILNFSLIPLSFKLSRVDCTSIIIAAIILLPNYSLHNTYLAIS